MKKTLSISILILIIVLGGAWFLFHRDDDKVEIFDKDENTPNVSVFDSNAALKAEINSDRKVGIEQYVTRNISGLSAEAGAPEVLGGTFHVTSIKATSGTGTVAYEDGHNAYTATFTYTTDKAGLVSVKTFVVKK
jgi:hypothetical protein